MRAITQHHAPPERLMLHREQREVQPVARDDVSRESLHSRYVDDGHVGVATARALGYSLMSQMYITQIDGGAAALISRCSRADKQDGACSCFGGSNEQANFFGSRSYNSRRT